MSRAEWIDIEFHLPDELAESEFWYEHVYFMLKDNGWVLDLTKPIEFLGPGEKLSVDPSEITVKSEGELIERIREKEKLNEALRLGQYSDGVLAFTFELKRVEFNALHFWFLVNGPIVDEETCVIFEKLSRRIVKPFCDDFYISKILMGDRP